MKHLEKYYIIKFAHNPNDPFAGRGSSLPPPQRGVLPGRPVAPSMPLDSGKGHILPGIPINTPQQQVAAGILPGKPVPASQPPAQPPTQSNTTQPTAMPRQNRSMFGTGISKSPLQGLIFDKDDGSLPIDPNMFKMFQTGMQR